MTLYEYIKKYGDYSFKEKKINEVDKVIFSFLSYANINGILAKKSKMTLEKIANIHKKKSPSKDNNIIAVKEGNKLLHTLKCYKRYKDCLIYHYEYQGDKETQFGAFTIEYEKNKVFVTFEGTDHLFSGWVEDFMLSYQFPTISQKKAITYLNKYFTLSKKELIVGGHSKGGNLALVGAMYASPFVKRKIKEIYNVDGPGLLEKEFKSKKYQNIQKKYHHIIPNYCLIGLFLNHSNDEVKYSTNKGILSHNIAYWEVEENHFKKTKLSNFSQELDQKLQEWFHTYNKADKQEFIRNLDLILDKASVTSIIELKENHKKILSLIYETKEMNSNTKKILEDFIKIIIECIKKTTKEEWENFISQLFKIKRK